MPNSAAPTIAATAAPIQNAWSRRPKAPRIVAGGERQAEALAACFEEVHATGKASGLWGPTPGTEFRWRRSATRSRPRSSAPTTSCGSPAGPRRPATTSPRSPTTSTPGSTRRATARSCGRCSAGSRRSTERIRVGTGVTCPTTRIHPAIVAQAAATAAAMLPGRFWLGIGSGENLNEHIVGQGWPQTAVRQERMEEAVEVIRLLWEGGLTEPPRQALHGRERAPLHAAGRAAADLRRHRGRARHRDRRARSATGCSA